MGSGKSFTASAVAKRLDGQRRSFGDAVRVEAKRRGLGDDRTALQDLGNVLIGEGWARFVELVMETVDHTDDIVVIDGIRHRDAISALRAVAGGRNVGVVFVTASPEVRISRLVERDGMTREAARQAMAHPNEREVDSLIDLADLVVDTDQSLELDALVSEIVSRFS